MHASKVKQGSSATREAKMMNKKITDLAGQANWMVIEHGVGSKRAETAIEDVLHQFIEVGEHSERLNHVNASTLLHRSAQLGACSCNSDSLEQRFPRLLECLVDVIYERHSLFDPRHTASAIWSFGLLGRQMLLVSGDLTSFPVCFSALLEKADTQAHLFSAQEVVSILNGISKLKLIMPACKKLIDKLIVTTKRKLGTFHAQELATCVWSLANLQYNIANKLLLRIVGKFKVQLIANNVQDQQLANFMWGIAKLGYEDTALGFCSSVSTHLVKRLPSINSQGLSTSVWALGSLRYLPSEDQLHAIAAAVSERMEKFYPIDVAKVIHAFAIFGRSFDCLTSSTKAYLASNLSRFGRQELCNALWSLAILEELDVGTFKHSIAAIKQYPNLSIGKMNSSERRQLYTCLIHIRSFCNGIDGEEFLPPEWLFLCEKAYSQGQQQKKTYSVALSVMLMLQKMGNACQNHSLHAQSSKVLDLVMTVEGVRVAVEVTIPTHYFVNRTHELKGPRLWAMKVMEAQGLVVLRVDCKHWNKLGTEARSEYIAQQLGISLAST